MTSQPFSRIPGNRSYRHTVCNVEVLVKGASQQLPEVRDALGNYTCSYTTNIDANATQANTSTPTLRTYKDDTDDDSDTTIMYESPQHETVLPYDSDKTVLPYDSDKTVLPYDSDKTVLPYDSDNHMTVTRLYYLLNLTIQKNFSVNQTAVHHWTLD